ncbi:hypothetical protein CDG81_19300 [Actinopolyspora erythraea]|uniref:Uncharacterized protein n=1 Tax=Actinopolyspora erythraea TaxID=414996 RepID=A0A223RW04_9ACTN|nr:DUF6350 family protein [Actinopolyspora erythraea]ASU80050.1 hypothetical protein CDG81_19300 [Actinopolyspora erythraea]
MTAPDFPTVETSESPARQRRRAIRGALFSAVLVILACYLLVVALLAFVVSTATAAEFVPSGVLLAAIPGWLAAFQVPLTVTGSPLSALPLLPTLLCVLLVARSSRRVARRHRLRKPAQALPVVLVMGLSHAVLGTVLAVALEDLRAPVRVIPWQAFCCCGLLAACAATAGLADRCGMLYQLWHHVPGDAWYAVRKGLLGSAAVIGTGAAVFGAAVCLALPRMHERSVELGGIGDAAGAALLALLYLPNAVLGGWAFVTGGGISFGGSAVTPLSTAPDALPPQLPMLAVLPPEQPANWTVALFAVPLLLGVLLGWSCRNLSERSRDRQHLVLLVVLLATLSVSIPAVLSGGRLGGEYGPFSLRPLLLAVTTFAWLALPALLTSRLAGRRDADVADPVGVAAVPDTGVPDVDPAGAVVETTDGESNGVAVAEHTGAATDTEVATDTGETPEPGGAEPSESDAPREEGPSVEFEAVEPEEPGSGEEPVFPPDFPEDSAGEDEPPAAGTDDEHSDLVSELSATSSQNSG